MVREVVSSPRVPRAPQPISQAIKLGNLIFTSGMTGRDPRTGELPDDVEQQIRNTFENLKALLEDAGTSLSNIIKTTIYLRDLADREKHLNKIWQEYFPKDPPARTTIQAGLGRLAVEIEAIAYVPS